MANVSTVQKGYCKTFVVAAISALLLPSTPAIADQRCNICPRDSNGRIQRSAAAKTEFRRTQPCPSNGQIKGACPGHVIDHVVALKRGGADSPTNMQWQTIAEARAKDRWE